MSFSNLRMNNSSRRERTWNQVKDIVYELLDEINTHVYKNEWFSTSVVHADMRQEIVEPYSGISGPGYGHDIFVCVHPRHDDKLAVVVKKMVGGRTFVSKSWTVDELTKEAITASLRRAVIYLRD